MQAVYNLPLLGIQRGAYPALKHIIAVACLLQITGCATLNHGSPASKASSPQDLATYEQHQANIAHIQDFSVQARMGVQTEGRGVSGSIRWQHINGQDGIALFSPMGGKMADVSSDAQGVTLVDSDGKIYQAADAETLTQQTLGWRLPVGNLADWLLGRPSNGEVTHADWDSSGKLSKLTQHGWEIQYLEYREVDGQALPSKLALRNPKLYMKLVIERWDIFADRQRPSINSAWSRANRLAASRHSILNPIAITEP